MTSNEDHRTLTLIRHAKSSWKQPLPDFERPLNKRGHRNAVELGRWLKSRGVTFDRIVSSPARRTMDTASLIVAQLGLPASVIEPDDNVYLASSTALLDLIRHFDDRFSRMALVGHNPGISRLAARLLPVSLDDELRTCACLQLRFDTPSWKKLSERSGEVVFFHDAKGRSLPMG